MFYSYILECNDGTLYTGYTIDLKKRLETHNNGKGAKYTRGRTPVKLVYSQKFNNKLEAQRSEREIKKLTRIQKLSLINGLK